MDAAGLFSLYFPKTVPRNAEAALEGISRFYRREDAPAPESTDEPGPIPYDFTVDAGAMVSDFQRRYGIDLTAPDLTMHWWRFMALLDGLYSYGMADRVGFRVADLSEMDSRQRARLMKQRAKFAIRPRGTTEDHIARLDEIIARHGGEGHG